MTDHGLKKRLLSVAEFVREGAVFADIGTDHGHLPIALISSGKISRAVCTDINQGPLSVAIANARAAGVDDKMDFFLSDGFDAFGNVTFTDAAICGMGGELILNIITRAVSRLCNPGINLILQPMSRVSVLRRGLLDLGFMIIEESYSSENGKYYVCMNVRYGANTCDAADVELGLLATRVKLNEAERGYLLAKRRSLKKSIDGILKSGKDASDKTELLLKIDQILN